MIASNWRARQGALDQLATYFKAANVESVFDSIPSLFVLTRDSTKKFNESNFNVSKSLLQLFITIFDIHSQAMRPPESYLYASATKLAVEKVGDKKQIEVTSSCLHMICTVKDPQRVLAVAVKTIEPIKSPLVHEALLNWFKSFCTDFGVASLSQGIQDCLTWVLNECESNNIKLRNAALDVFGEMHSQLGPVVKAFIKSKDIQSSTTSLLERLMSMHPHNTNATEREMKCITLLASNNSSKHGSSPQPNASSLLSIPTTDLMAELKSDCISRINTTEGKAAWKVRRDAMEEVKVSVNKCGGLITTEGKALLSLKELFLALRSRLNDSQSNLKPVAATLIGSLLNHLDSESQATLGKVVFAQLANAVMNDMKKTMRDAAVTALSMGTEQDEQNGGGVNQPAIECFIVCLESQLSDAALKSSGLPDVLAFLAGRLEECFPVDDDAAGNSTNALSVNRQLGKVLVMSLLSSKAGSRSAAEKLLSICTSSGIVPSEALDKEIGKLLPAQQRTVRTSIPKNSIRDQQLVDTFKRAANKQPVRPSSSLRKPVQRSQPAISSIDVTSAPPISNNEANPLALSGLTKSSKQKRLSVLGRNDNWPEYPEDPSGDIATFQTLCKTWSHLISPSSIQLLFPKAGLRSHEDAVRGCELLAKSIDYSRSSSSFLEEQLDLIFKWLACALSARDHTSGLRSLLSTIQHLFQRLCELSYVINDPEATILLPYIIEKAGIAKSQFKNHFIALLSCIRTNKLYPTKLYGSNICMKVVGKSTSIFARSLAASECTLCVQEVGAGAISSKGVSTLAKALSQEKLTDIRKFYLDLFDIVVRKTSLDKVLSLCVGVSDTTKEQISDWCSKQSLITPVNDPQPSKLSIPGSRNSTLRTSTSPRSDKADPGLQFSSSSKAAEQLRSRFQSIKPADEVYTRTMDDILAMINHTGAPENGQRAIRTLGLAVKGDSDGLNASQVDILRQSITSDLDRFIMTMAGTLKVSFEHDGTAYAELPSPLIQEIVTAMSYVFRTPEYAVAMSQESIECCLREAVDALLDDRLDTTKGAPTGVGSLVKTINKLAMRAAVSPPLEISLLALLSLQTSIIQNNPDKGRAARVLTKLFHKVTKDEREQNPTNPLGGVSSWDALLRSLDWLLQIVEKARLEGVCDGILKHSTEMSKDLMTELVTCKGGDFIQNAVVLLELPNGGSLLQKLLVTCVQDTEGLQQQDVGHPPRSHASLSVFQESQAESVETRLAGLINNFAEAEDGPAKQVALIALIDSGIDLEAQLSHVHLHLSPHFKQFILDQVNKASKENSPKSDTETASSSFSERVTSLRLRIGEEQMPTQPPPPAVGEKSASLRARLEALKQSKD